MPKRIATLAMLVLLLAALAFVVDVVSPFTPTPNAAFAKPLSSNVGKSSGLLSKELNLPRRPRSLIALICLLLC